MLKGFRDFLLKGDLITAAVGLVMALATFTLTEALVENLITPIIAAIFGQPNFESLTFTIHHSQFRYGDLLNAAFTFLTIAAVVFFLVVAPVNSLMARRAKEDPATKECPECTSPIPIKARRCPECTSAVPAAAA